MWTPPVNEIAELIEWALLWAEIYPYQRHLLVSFEDPVELGQGFLHDGPQGPHQPEVRGGSFSQKIESANPAQLSQAG
jgi:hypothetical protein